MKDSYSSFNSYGYSPRPLREYIEDVKVLLKNSTLKRKPIIISITSSDPVELKEMLELVATLRDDIDDIILNESHELKSTPATHLIGIELNTSCPNIPGKPPPSYDVDHLIPLLTVLEGFNKALTLQEKLPITLGLKLPPYVYATQFENVVAALRSLTVGTISFITCTNTLGTNVLFSEQVDNGSSGESDFALSSAFGGMAGDAIHALSLGCASASW